MIHCLNHGTREADYHCAQCQAGFCSDCINIKEIGSGKVEVCPRCSNAVVDLAPYKPVPPFWTRTPYLFTWPFQDQGWMMFLGWAIFALVLRGLAHLGFSFGGFLFAGAGGAILAAYYSMLISYFYRIVARTEEGKFKVPGWTELDELGCSMFMPVVYFMVACIAVFYPYLLFFTVSVLIKGGNLLEAGKLLASPAGIIALVVCILIGLPFLPMALLIMGVFRNVKFVLNPVFLVLQIMKIPKEYGIALGLIAGMLIVYSIIQLAAQLVLAAIGGFFSYFLVFPLDGMFQLYFFMFLGNLLGYMAYQTRFKLKWWPENVEEPVFMVGGREVNMGQTRPSTIARAASGAAAAAVGAGAAGAVGLAAKSAGGEASAAPVVDEELSRKVNDGMAMIEHGRHQEAFDLFKQLLDENPGDMGALRGMVLASIRLKDVQSLQKYADMQAAELIKQKSFENLWETFQNIKKSIPEFVHSPRNQFALSRWLSHSEEFMEAAKALRELAVKFPDHPMAPKALFQCGEILWKSCNKPENARQMFEYILKRYPDVAFADQVHHAMSQIEER